MKAWLRQHRYALAITLKRLGAQPFSWLANLLVMALVLALPLLGSAVLVSVQPLARQISVTPELTLYVQPTAPAGTAAAITERIGREFGDQIAAVRLMPRDQALKTLRQNPAWSGALAVLPENPLPDAVVVTLAGGDDLAQRAGVLADGWRKWQYVDQVQLDSAWVQRLEAILRFASLGLGFLAICVAVVVLATVFNTVRMQALTQREEIAVARLVGATESFVRRPFLYQGALSGALAALLAIAAAAAALVPLNQAVLRLARSYSTEFALHLPEVPALAAAVIAAGVLGALSARWSVTRSTRF
ncbi:cell division protein FtsX [Bordetella holmesii]|uniref:Cell division protein FtsX n=2 Tax=Bordetella holmesii TaxID=35814 RepID=A0A158M8U7_9BORD|nr:permease-like cell division protein FtsX [Bordetella holmesii]AHV94132.1 ftsX-like permease family protein [Bordetella holmesii ATCC 51541]AIT26558.1 ftsX-like permease family protein [Bordetella holmesii 44057]EWM43594.1 ftsX-like permease family protein [Bordetella holmesii 41130]EWM47137.1 ftsX-like permease family protein [Bordetella holmesii 35009]EWM51301.1 ftsX-like permease family protein [Bordetella holmesii 70147]